jgi:hypothetical protein
MNVEIGAEAAQFPEKEYINGIAVAVQEPYGPGFLNRTNFPTGSVTNSIPQTGIKTGS